jgi:hypothetical protein
MNTTFFLLLRFENHVLEWRNYGEKFIGLILFLHFLEDSKTRFEMWESKST